VILSQGIHITAVIIALFPSDFIDRTSIMVMNSVVFRLVSGFCNHRKNILPIRQIDHTFIPLSFHWSGRYLKTRLLHDGFINEFDKLGLPPTTRLFKVDTKWNYILSIIKFKKDLIKGET
jgi:hypothetical protein